MYSFFDKAIGSAVRHKQHPVIFFINNVKFIISKNAKELVDSFRHNWLRKHNYGLWCLWDTLSIRGGSFHFYWFYIWQYIYSNFLDRIVFKIKGFLNLGYVFKSKVICSRCKRCQDVRNYPIQFKLPNGKLAGSGKVKCYFDWIK